MTPATLLIVEDESFVAMDLRARLEGHGYRVSGIAPSGEEALAHVRAHRPDLVLMDIHLGPGMNGVDTHRALKAFADIPVVYLTAYADPETLDAAKVLHPMGYLLKPFDESTLLSTLEIALARHEADTTRAREDLRLRALLENAYDFVAVVDPQGLIQFQSPSTARLLDRPASENLGRSAFEQVHPDDHPLVMKGLMQLVEDPTGEVRSDIRVRHADGTYRILEVVAKNALKVPGVEGIVINSRDVTDRRASESRERDLQAQAHHANHLESLEVLAGGLAHDFNNLLQGILGNLTLALDDLPPDAGPAARLHAAEEAGLRAADLVSQMLAFAGKGRYAVEALDLSVLVQGLAPALASLMPAGTRLSLDLQPGLPTVVADPSQLKQCLQALVVNGIEALEGREGEVRIRTGTLDALPSEHLRVGQALEGPCAFLEVTDTGHGIPEDQLARIFEPFFSTRFSGRGLGLSAVMGIVRGHKGGIQVESAVGQGSTFRVALPTLRTLPAPVLPHEEVTLILPDHARILVVDDEEVVRQVAGDFLESLGYAVSTAPDGPTALELLRLRPEAYGLLLLDLTMPAMGGIEVLRTLRAEGITVPVLMTSGFSLRDLSKDLEDEGVGFIQKPYSMGALEEKVKGLYRGRA